MLYYRLRPKGAFHFGAHGIDAERSAERCTSDTLYAALLVEALQAGRPSFTALVEPTPGASAEALADPPWRLSSCFPYAGDVLLLPRPHLPLSPALSEAEGRRKQLKHLAYVSPAIFRLIIEQSAGSLDPYLPGVGADRGRLAMGGKVWIAREDGAPAEPFWRVAGVSHVTVDRVRAASAYYQVGQVHFAPHCGLYLFCHERAPGAAGSLTDLLQRLGDSGLGGRRSYGLGQFSVDGPHTLDLPDRPDPARLVLLSRYRPSPAELGAGVLGPGASYDLERVEGWLQTPDPSVPARLRRNVRLLTEGSVIHMLPGGTPPGGTICDVRPGPAPDPFPHPVWRYGLALGVGIGAQHE